MLQTEGPLDLVDTGEGPSTLYTKAENFFGGETVYGRA